MLGLYVVLLKTFITVIYIPWNIHECSFVVAISIISIDAARGMFQCFMMLSLKSRGNAVSNFFNPRKLAFLAWFYKLSFGLSRCFSTVSNGYTLKYLMSCLCFFKCKICLSRDQSTLNLHHSPQNQALYLLKFSIFFGNARLHFKFANWTDQWNRTGSIQLWVMSNHV